MWKEARVNKFRQLLVMVSLVLPAFVLADVVPGSIDFNNPLLWGKSVTAGFDDEGGTTGETHWHIGASEGTAAIYRKNGESAGYIRTKTETDLHRTMPALKPTEVYDGPAPAGGREIPTEGLFIDTRIAVQPHPVMEVRTTGPKDKINCWLYMPEDGSVTNFVITAGKIASDGSITPVNYVTDAPVVPGREFQLTIRAIANAFSATNSAGEAVTGYVGFEVRVDGALVSSQGKTLFPSLVAPTSAYGKKMYSFGVSGAATLDRINFTKDNPEEKPDYDKDDVSMLREFSTVEVRGYPEIGAAPLTNFPVLVRISEAAVKGFRYTRCADNGGDIRFTDANGKLLPCEIDTWDPAGESLIWVKVPYFLNGTALTMHWGLKSDGTPPENDAADVWSEYLGVWHMGDRNGVSYRDSTGRGRDATALGGKLKEAGETIVGKTAKMEAGDLVTTVGDIRPGEFEELTFTGWYRGYGYDTSNCQMIVGSKYGAASHEEMKAADGWCLHLHKSTKLLYQDTTGQEDSANMSASLVDNWTFLGFSVGVSGNYGGTRRYACSSETLQPSDCWTVSEMNRQSVVSTNAVLLLPAGFMADELRLTRMVRSYDWVKAEHDQVTNRAYCSYGAANVKGRDNFWLREPSITPNSASTENAGSIVVDVGEPRFGVSFVRFYDAAGNLLTSQPTTAGNYRAVFIVNEGVKDGLEKELSFVIFDTRAYRSISGHDRVMLFNSDVTPECPVGLQGYHDVDSQTNKVWLHEGMRWTGVGRFVLPGTRHVYFEPETGRKLWEFRNARIGNLFQDDEELADRMNFLPWGGQACRFDDSELPANAQRYAGTLILQNKSLKSATDNDPAAAYSPYYEQGVGTIYFDAVNSSCDYPNVLKLQVCGTPEGSAGVNVGKWSDVKVDVFAISNGVYNADMSSFGTSEIAMSMKHVDGTTNWFYRVRATIDTNMPVRVRIVRNDDTENWDGGMDDEGLVTIDNIVVSYPAMGIAISQFGAPAEPDNIVQRGQRAPFDIAFPTARDLGKFHAQARVKYIVNNTNEVDSSFVGSMTMTYRWRYLNQKIGDWKELTLTASGDDPERFVSSAPIEGEGIGDIEYFGSAVVNAPFYEYWDYSGLGGWHWPDAFTERRGDVKISALADGVYAEDHLSPALGTDYFIRLREGASDYEGVRLHVKRTNGAADDPKTKEEVVEMRLSNDHTWRGLYQVVTNGFTNAYYRVEAYNLQPTTGGGDYQWNTNWFFGENQADLPANDVLEVGDGTRWTRLPTDELTGYIMFQLEDTTRSVSIIHADYQDFNAWTDASVEGGYFLGTSTALPTSGVSRTARSWSDAFGLFTETIATNILWSESFNLSEWQYVTTTGTWAINQPFTGAERITPNGWTAANGMWVSERFNELGGKSFALQMKGEGYGTVMMPQLIAPRGLRTFRFDARVSQTYDSHPFDYYVGTTNDVYNYTDYTFAVPCVMESEKDGSFSGVGTVSAVARYRDSKGGYEVRVERITTSEVELSLYKWLSDGSAKLLGTSPIRYPYGGTSACCLDAADGKFGALFISCENTEDSVWITAGLMAKGQNVDRALEMTGWNYYKISYEDKEEDQYRSGTCGVGCKNCPATFVRPVLSFQPVDLSKDGALRSGELYYWKDAKTVFFPDERVLLGSEADYDRWNSYAERLPEKVDGDFPTGFYGFKAKSPNQIVVIEASPHLENRWTDVATNSITSFGFTSYETNLFLTADVDVRLRTGRQAGSPDVVVDNLYADQWRGEDYDDADNPDRTGVFYFEVDYGAPTNFVYTTAWIDSDGAAEISPMRTTVDRPSGIRAPLMDGERNNSTDGSVRGLGLGQFSFTYRDADRRARLIVQVWTNDVSRTRLSSRTESTSSEYWSDVKVYDFSTMTEDERKGGLISCYVGQHGIKGVMRVIVDPTLVEEAQDPTVNQENDPNYGRIFITSAGAKDNPVLDSGSWWGWNLRTTDDPKRQMLSDGSYDPRTWGQSFALNNSVEAGIRIGDVYDTHKPFLQTPILTRGSIGEITFKARKYDAGDAAPSVAVYGMTEYDPAAKDEAFHFLTNIVIDCERYETFTYQAPVNKNYTAFRLAVTGVDGIVGDESSYPEDDPPAGPSPYTGKVRRVLIDEVAVFEAIKARLGFCKVGAFRNHLNDNGVVPNMPCKEEQPLCNESWGIQTELYAVRLSERIDYTREPQVTLHWYEGYSPWGYENWATNPAACSAKLSRADGATNLVYRSSYLASPDSVIPMSTKPGTIVQFSLEVVYYMEGQEVALTNVLSSADWERPEWFNPVDYNQSFGKGGAYFSAFTILDEVSPGWAWFNEINLFGAYEKYVNTDKANQYIEIAAPAEANLQGWSVRLLESQRSTDSVITNQLVTFGSGGLASTKAIGSESNMVFHVIANAATRDAGKLKREDGTLDGVWTVPHPTSFVDANGVITFYRGMGFQLVRKTGVVEQEIVAIGTNLYWNSSGRSDYFPSNVVSYLNEHLNGSKFFEVGSDDNGRGQSLGVIDSQGESSNVWTKVMVETPGRINQNQQINPEHPTPNGSSITVYANLAGPHIYQTVGEAYRTNLNQIVIIRKGSAIGTNITYHVDEWYELKDVGVTEGGTVWTYEPSQREVTVTVAKGCSNNTLTVTAEAQVDKRLRDLGVDENNRYTPAIIDWLEQRTSLKDVYGTGTEWPESDGNVYLAQFMGLNRQVITNMTLTQMYWLDICPTISNQVFVAGMAKPPLPALVPGYSGSASVTNDEMSVFMMISNRVEDSSSPYYGKAWAPYTLRGLEPGSSSLDYEDDSEWGWTNVSFKITGILANGLTSEKLQDNWVPVRFFVFKEDSFKADFTTSIMVPNAHSPRSLGYQQGWGKWFAEHPDDTSPVFYSWAIDERLLPVNVEILQQDNPYK